MWRMTAQSPVSRVGAIDSLKARKFSSFSLNAQVMQMHEPADAGRGHASVQTNNIRPPIVLKALIIFSPHDAAVRVTTLWCSLFHCKCKERLVQSNAPVVADEIARSLEQIKSARPGDVCHALNLGGREMRRFRSDAAAPLQSPACLYTSPVILCMCRPRPEDSGVSGREATALKGNEGAGQAWHHWREMRPLYGLK